MDDLFYRGLRIGRRSDRILEGRQRKQSDVTEERKSGRRIEGGNSGTGDLIEARSPRNLRKSEGSDPRETA